MLTDTELSNLHDKAMSLPDGKLEQALRFALAEQDYRQVQPATYDTERVDAWIMALRMEQARRDGKLRTLSDTNEKAFTRLWLQIAAYRDKLLHLGLDVQLRIDEIEDHQVRVAMVISGPPGVVGSEFERASTRP